MDGTGKVYAAFAVHVANYSPHSVRIRSITVNGDEGMFLVLEIYGNQQRARQLEAHDGHFELVRADQLRDAMIEEGHTLSATVELTSGQQFTSNRIRLDTLA